MNDIERDVFMELLNKLENDREELQEILNAESRAKWENRRWIIHPYNQGRLNGEGFFHTSFQELKLYPDKFKLLTRMTPDTFASLLRLVEHEIRPRRKRRNAISAEQRLAMTLW